MRSPLHFESPNCAGTDTEAFYPEGTATAENELAKRVCANCLHIDECLEWGLHYEQHGVWGGLSSLDRRNLRPRRGIVLETPHLAFLPLSVRAS